MKQAWCDDRIAYTRGGVKSPLSTITKITTAGRFPRANALLQVGGGRPPAGFHIDRNGRDLQIHGGILAHGNRQRELGALAAGKAAGTLPEDQTEAPDAAGSQDVVAAAIESLTEPEMLRDRQDPYTGASWATGPTRASWSRPGPGRPPSVVIVPTGLARRRRGAAAWSSRHRSRRPTDHRPRGIDRVQSRSAHRCP